MTSCVPDDDSETCRANAYGHAQKRHTLCALGGALAGNPLAVKPQRAEIVHGCERSRCQARALGNFAPSKLVRDAVTLRGTNLTCLFSMARDWPQAVGICGCETLRRCASDDCKRELGGLQCSSHVDVVVNGRMPG